MSIADPYAGMNAAATMAIAGVSLLGAFYLAFRTWRDGQEIRALRNEVDEIRRRTDRSYLNGKEIEVVLRDLYRRIEKTIILSQATTMEDSVKKGQADRIRRQKLVCDKHFQELELFSRDDHRRNVALTQITYGIGDWASLDTLKACIDVFSEPEKQEFIRHSKILEKRLRSGVVTDSSSWTGN